MAGDINSLNLLVENIYDKFFRVETHTCILQAKIVKNMDLDQTTSCIIRASMQQNLSSGFPTKRDSNQSPQLQRLARKLKFRL